MWELWVGSWNTRLRAYGLSTVRAWGSCHLLAWFKSCRRGQTFNFNSQTAGRRERMRLLIGQNSIRGKALGLPGLGRSPGRVGNTRFPKPGSPAWAPPALRSPLSMGLRTGQAGLSLREPWYEREALSFPSGFGEASNKTRGPQTSNWRTGL